MDVGTLTNGLAALVSAIVAGAIVVECRRVFGHVPVAALALSAFFAVRAMLRVLPSSPDSAVAGALVVVGDVAVVGFMALMLWHGRRARRQALLLVERAREHASEYERATGDYARLMRHRIANPLTVIKGAALTLQDHRNDARRHPELITAIVMAAEELEHVCLDARPATPAERDLDALPRVDGATGSADLTGQGDGALGANGATRATSRTEPAGEARDTGRGAARLPGNEERPPSAR